MHCTVEEFLQQYEQCQRFKTYCMKPTRLLQPLPVPIQVWTDISIDFIEGLPSSHGYNCIMVVVDHLSKYAHLIPLKHPYTAIIVAKAFISNIIRLYGILTSIVSECDKVFISIFWRTLFQFQGTQLCMSSSYHPQSDGQTEVVNWVLEQYLQCFAGDQPWKWFDWISWAEFSYNTSVHSSTKVMLFKMVFGVSPPSLLTYVLGTSMFKQWMSTCVINIMFFMSYGGIFWSLKIKWNTKLINIVGMSLILATICT
jgi:hypothetical protein